MHNSNELNSCKICGYYESSWFPWGVDGRTPSFDICPQCNVQFGYEDCNDEAVKSYRKIYAEKQLQSPWGAYHASLIEWF